MADRAPAHATRWLWPLLALPGTAWLAVFFVAPMYVVLAILFGTVDPILRRPIPVWNPVSWDVSQFRYVLEHITGADGFFGPALMRTVGYVAVASVLCLFIAYPVAYYTARFAGRWRGLLLAALIAPFWISYMMRMLAWVNLLQTDGLVNRTLSVGGLFDVQPSWLSGRPSTVILGLVYGYVPYMILPLFAGLDRLVVDGGESLVAYGYQRGDRRLGLGQHGLDLGEPLLRRLQLLHDLELLVLEHADAALEGNHLRLQTGQVLRAAHLAAVEPLLVAGPPRLDLFDVGVGLALLEREVRHVSLCLDLFVEQLRAALGELRQLGQLGQGAPPVRQQVEPRI